MERARLIATAWPWLPAFRAIAETEHLPTASAALHVTPSALSRTLRLLEEEMGRPLFERVGRRLVLNPAGQLLLQSVRRAMREVHEAYVHLDQSVMVGDVHLGVPGPFAPLYVLPALAELREVHPGLMPHLHAASGLEAQSALERGDLDLALIDDPIDDPELEQRVVRELAHDVFTAPRLGPLEDPVFVAPPPDVEGRNRDAWPDERPRTVGLRVDRMATAIDAVRQGPWAAVLPVDVGLAAGLEPLGQSAELRVTRLTLMHRRTLGRPGRAEAVAALIARALERRGGEPGVLTASRAPRRGRR